MKLKIALIAVALIAGSAWAGKMTIPSFTFNGNSYTVTSSKLICDFDGDSAPDILVSGHYGMLDCNAVYSWEKSQFLLIDDKIGVEATFDDGLIVGSSGTYYTYDNGTTAASPNP